MPPNSNDPNQNQTPTDPGVTPPAPTPAPYVSPAAAPIVDTPPAFQPAQVGPEQPIAGPEFNSPADGAGESVATQPASLTSQPVQLPPAPTDSQNPLGVPTNSSIENSPATHGPDKKNLKVMLIIGVGVLVLAALGYAAYLVFSNS